MAQQGSGSVNNANGGHNQITMANGQPAVVGDYLPLEAEGGGQNVVFTRRNSDGSWTAKSQVMTIGDTQAGPSMGFDATAGFMVAAVDRTSDTLFFSESTNQGSTWSTPYPVFQSGSGGWWPSIAIGPTTHDPSIAFFVCAKRQGVAEGSCVAAEREIRIAERVEGNSNLSKVAAGDYSLLKLAFFPDGKRVLAFRDFWTGAVKVAVEQ
jgi:hypothetical protein